MANAASSNETTALNIEVLCLLEGISVPVVSAQVSYGVNMLPTCTVNLPAHSLIRDLPERTKVALFFRDFCPEGAANEYKWRLLFDGELYALGYNLSPDGAVMSLQVMHAVSELDLMKIMTLSIGAYLYDPSAKFLGEATMVSLWGNRVNEIKVTNFLSGHRNLFNGVADIVYLLFHTVLTDADVAKSATGAYYAKKLGDGPTGSKIPARFYGINPELKKQIKDPSDPLKIKSWSTAADPDPTDGIVTTTESSSGSGAGQLLKPADGEITSGYGDRMHPIYLTIIFHDGIDIGASYGSEIKAAADGKVTYSEFEAGGAGWWCLIEHAGGMETSYMHCMEHPIAVGSAVKRGQVIAKVGSTGASTGAHLHFRLHINGKAADPTKYF